MTFLKQLFCKHEWEEFWNTKYDVDTEYDIVNGLLVATQEPEYFCSKCTRIKKKRV